jgi:serine/threonine protein phosphatase PrpC
MQLGGGANHAFGGDVVTAVPDVVQRRVSHRDEFIVLGCDGLFDVMTPQDVVDFVRPRLARLRASRSSDDGDEGSAGAGGDDGEGSAGAGVPGDDCSAVGINEIAKQLVDQAIDVLGSMDNVSVIIVELHADGKRDDEG